MNESYHRLIEILIKRELGILGKEKVEKILNDLGITFDFQAQKLINFKGEGQEVLQRLGEKIYESGGDIALIGARVSMILNAVKERVQLPPIFS
jgi:hypothetical protein